ncbi:hypothetical protein NW768_004090 [Fusarium equiseti]|uniref:Heterokaryon incompatibility domain-containing protein n=1 Tax=Fusarium equiseti TaxID=61235 RepID=A0ABQ8RJK3_FUSEQ|nr:hypothetical protein NW768_004090 [Fusarium equiseti]
MNAPLDRNGREIRLIEILPTYANQTIQCKLHTVTLTPDTYYVCISYVWGDPHITEEIVVNGVRKQVTVNLATALRHLKKHWVEIERESDPDLDTSKFRLWADALCINQDDTLEKGHQVGLMADIYSSAEMVLAWLSSDDRDVALGFTVLNRVWLEPELRRATSLLFRKGSGVWENNDAQLRVDEPLAHLSQLWKLGFWSRMWIHQEVLLAKRAYYISPSHRMSHRRCWLANRRVNIGLSKFRYFANSRRRLGQRQRQRQEQINKALHDQRGVMNLFEANPARTTTKEQRILACINLHLSENLQASEDLDYVYGLLAVTKVPIEPDYAKPIREVHMELMQWLFSVVPAGKRNTNKRIVFEVLDRHAVGIRQLYGLPTWAPVFSDSDKRRKLNLPLHFTFHDVGSKFCSFEDEVFRIVRTKQDNDPGFDICKPLPMITPGGSLWIEGIKLGTVRKVYHEPGYPDFIHKGLSSFLHDFPEMHRKGAHPYGMSTREALCSTLLLESDFRSNVPLRKTTEDWELAAEHLLGSMLFTTKNGYMGLIGEEVLPGDVVCYLVGGTSLTVLRRKGRHYLFVDNCSITGFGYKQVGELLSKERCEVKAIEIR